MMEQLVIFLDRYYFDKISNIIGLLITIFGFVVTISNAKRAKTAAQQANEAVQQVKKAITEINTVSDISAAIMILDEIKRLHRSKSWHITLDRYSYLRRNLNSITHRNQRLSDEHKACIKETIDYLLTLEASMEKNLMVGIDAENISKINKALSSKAEKIHRILLDLKAVGDL